MNLTEFLVFILITLASLGFGIILSLKWGVLGFSVGAAPAAAMWVAALFFAIRAAIFGSKRQATLKRTLFAFFNLVIALVIIWLSRRFLDGSLRTALTGFSLLGLIATFFYLRAKETQCRQDEQN